MRSRTRAILATAAETLALSGIFVSALLGGLALHSDHPATRRMVASIANQALGSLFQGRIVVGKIERLSLGSTGHVRVSEAEILDPEGHRILLAKGIDAKIDLVLLLRSIKAGRPPAIAIADPRIESVDLLLDLDERGDLGIARAFLSRPSTTPPKPVVPGAPLPEDVTLSIPIAHVHHASVHGNLVPPRLDGDADDIVGSVAVVHNQLSVTVQQARATLRSPRGPGQVGDVRGVARGNLTMPVATEPGAPSGVHALAMQWTLDGDGAGIPLTARLALANDRLEAIVDIPLAQPNVVRRAFPALPFARPAQLHARAEGKLPELAITAEGRLGDSAFTAQGAIALREGQPFHLDADLTRIDGAAFAGPASDVSGHVHVEGAIAGGAPAGTFKVTTKESTVLSQRAPAIAAEGAFDGRHVTATFRASEPGVDVDGEVDLHVPEKTLDFDVRARSRDLRILARAPGVVAGSGTAHATGTLDLAGGTVHARFTADGTGISRDPASAGNVHAEGKLEGPVANPVIDVTASGTQIRLSAAGPAGERKDPLTYPSATGRARIVLAPTPRLVGAEVHVEGGDKKASIVASAREIRFEKGSVEAIGGRVEGLGAPLEIDAHVTNGALSVRAKGTDIDVQRLATMTGIAQLRLLPEGSRATLDVDVKSTDQRADGHFDISLAGAKDGTAAELHGTIDGRHVRARGRVALASVGWVEMPSAELELPGAPSLSAVQRATGSVDLRGELDLSQGAALFAGEMIEQISGRAFLSARIERGAPNNLPTVYASARTRGLDVTFNNEGKSTHIGGLDGSVHVGYDGATDETQTSLLTWDAKGIVASGDAKARVPLVAWVTGAKKVDRDVLGALEIAAVFEMPGRGVADLPGVFARPDLRGDLSAHAEVTGSVAHPNVTLIARASNLGQRQTAARTGPTYEPIAGVLDARWNGTDLVATVTVDEAPHRQAPDKPPHKPKRKTGHVRGLVLGRLPIADLFAGRPLAWNASAELDVTDLELAPLPIPQNVRGVLTGHVRLRNLSGTPELVAATQVDGLTIGGAKVMRGELNVDMKDGNLDATATIRQDDGGNGHVHLASRALQWQGTSVDWDSSRSTRLDYGVDRMRLAILRPFVRRSIPEIDGRVDGSGSATVDATSQVFEGGLTLSQGRFYVNAIGEEITEVGAVAHFEKNGVFRIQDATGKVGAGEIKASATGRMKGLALEAAEAVVIVPTKEGVPLSAEGATFAQATGEIRLSATVAPDTKAFLVTVSVPRSKVTVPDRGTQALQSLDPDESIAIGIRQTDGSLLAPTERPAAANRTRAPAAAAAAGVRDTSADLIARFTVALGDDVELEGRGLRVFLGGRTVVDLTDEVAVTGQISLRNGGTIDAQGRKFIVDRGTVTFIEGANPADPLVVAAAYWDAPDQTRVWVEFNGPLKTGKLTLRSEPAYSKSEILSILLFGRADPNQAPQGERPSDGQQAAALGTGIASSGLNKALGELDEDLDLEQDRTSANRVRTKVGYRLRRNLKVQVGYASGFSQREPDTTYLFLEWQFVPKWSLIGTRGDRGTSILDVLFQHRY